MKGDDDDDYEDEDEEDEDCDCSENEDQTVCGMDGNDYDNACVAECHGGGRAFDGSCLANLDCAACADDNRDCVAEDHEMYVGTCDEGFVASEGCHCSEMCPPGSFACLYEADAVDGAVALGPALLTLLSAVLALQ